MALAKDPICSIQTSTLLEDGSDGFISQAVNYQPEQPHSLINFKGSWYDNFIHRSNGPLLSFEQNEKGRQHTTCLRTSGYKHGHSMVDQWDPRAVEDFSCFETASNGDWLYYDEVVFADSSSIQDPGSLKLISGVPIWDKLVVELGLDLFAVNDEKFKDTFVSPAAIEVLQHKRQSLQNRKKREANIMPKLDGRRIRKLERLIQSLQP